MSCYWKPARAGDVRGRLFKRNRNVAAASLCSDREESREIDISTSLSSQPLSISQISYFPLVKPAEKLEGRGVQLLLSLQLRAEHHRGWRQENIQQRREILLFLYLVLV